MKQFIRDYFTFNNREKRGLIILTSIIVVLLLTLLLQEKFIIPDTLTDYSEFEAKINKATSFENILTEDETFHSTLNPKHGTLHPTDKLFSFDPNSITNEEWKILGIKEKQINTINIYKKKGGKFFKKEDLKKIYGISEADYKRIESYIVISNTKPVTPNVSYRAESRYEGRNPSTQTNKTSTIIEINSADSLSLLTLNGIGPSFTSRIIKYRNLLGGFYKKEQLLEVYGFTKEMFDNISGRIEVDNKKIKNININTSTIDQLKKHPYIKFNNARLIVNYRNAHGKYKQVDEIKNIHLINDSTFNKMSFYLITN